jgi:hypothetical protein
MIHPVARQGAVGVVRIRNIFRVATASIAIPVQENEKVDEKKINAAAGKGRNIKTCASVVTYT